MSQELLFLLFMVAEGIFLVVLYQAYLVPRVISPAVVDHWLAEIESGRIDLPKVLNSYTGELIQQVDYLLFGYTDPENPKKHINGKIQTYMPQLLGGYMSGGIKQLKMDPDNATAAAVAEYLDDLPLPARLVAQSVLPKIQEALSKATPKVNEAIVKYDGSFGKL